MKTLSLASSRETDVSLADGQQGRDQATRRAFWRAFMGWLTEASDVELIELERVIDAQRAEGFTALASQIRAALEQDDLRQTLPRSLVQRLQCARWPSLRLSLQPIEAPASASWAQGLLPRHNRAMPVFG